jgi:hypothetical protein
MAPGGTIAVTTASGVTRVTPPPGLRDPADGAPWPEDEPAPF